MLHDILAAHSWLNDFFGYIQHHWGEHNTAYGRSYSAAMLEALNAWGLIEGSHLLFAMLFFGNIMVFDSRLLGLTFRKTPISELRDKLLPLTIISMVILMASGVFVFFSKPQDYYHNIWFRLKMIVLVLAVINVWIFHFVVEKDRANWDKDETPPTKARMSAVISLTSWVLVIAFGRLIAYSWFECGKPHSAWMNTFEGCAVSPLGAMTPEDFQKQLAEEKTANDAAAAAQAAAPAVEPASQPGATSAAPKGAAKPEAK